MNPKLILAFLGGAAVASGIVYTVVKPDTKPKSLFVETVQPSPQTAVSPAARPASAADTGTPSAAAPVPSAPVASSLTPPPVMQAAPRPLYKAPENRRREPPVQMARSMPPAGAPQTAVAPSAPASPALPTVSAPPLPVIPPPSASSAEAERTAPAPPPEPPRAEPVQPHTVTLTAGTPLSVRIGETLSTHRNKPGDTFLATLAEPLTIDDFVIAERGSRCEGRVVEVDEGGRVKGVARLGIELTTLHTSDGQRVKIHTQSFAKDAPTNRREDAAKVGGGAALGAIIGAIAGGGKGAGIGAAAGGAAGAGDVALTRGKPAEIAVETRVSFRVQEPVTITEKLQ